MAFDRSLGSSARSSLTWAGGILLLRGVLQFATMLILVRLLTPTDYGSAALAQSIVGVFSVLSMGTFVAHALQARNPDDVDWQVHFTAALVGNSALTLVTLGLAWALSFSSHYAPAALPLAVLSTAFIVEIPATLRLRMLQVAHNWRRYRLLAFYGTFLSCLTSIAIALLGGGVGPLSYSQSCLDCLRHSTWSQSGIIPWRGVGIAIAQRQASVRRKSSQVSREMGAS